MGKVYLSKYRTPAHFCTKKASEMKISEKKEWAKLLFIKENLTQKEIAAKVGTTEKTLSKWVNAEHWEHLKVSIVITKEEELRRLYEQLSGINSFIKESPQKFATPGQADTITKLAAAIRSLETDISLADTITVAQKFINFLRPIDLEKAKEVTLLFDAFIKDSAKKV